MHVMDQISPASPQTRRPRTQPIKAARALLNFLRNKEDTAAILRFIRYVDGPKTARRAAQFAATPLGQAALKDRRDLAARLIDRAALAAAPAGSLARAYLDFVTRENISPEGFQAEIDASGARHDDKDDQRYYMRRLSHAHDLFHVVTGYGRDFVGELSLLAFSEPQFGSRALAIIRRISALKAMHDYPGLQVFACMGEGYRLGRRAADLTSADWEALLMRPLADVRRELKVGVPRRYLSVQTAANCIDRRYREHLAAPA